MRRTLPSRRTETIIWVSVTAVTLLLYAGSWWLVLKLEGDDRYAESEPSAQYQNARPTDVAV